MRRDVLDQPVGHHPAHFLLVLVHLHHVCAVGDVVEGDQHDSGLVRLLDDRPEGAGTDRDRDDGVIAGIDEVLDRRDLRRHIGASADDLELLDVRLDRRVFDERLGGLDHLNSPGVADEAVGYRDAVRPRLGGPLEVLGVLVPGLEALRLGTGAAHHLVPGSRRGRSIGGQPQRNGGNGRQHMFSVHQ